MRKGEEMGRFNLGSTIVLTFAARPGLKFAVRAGERVKFGREIFSLQ